MAQTVATITQINGRAELRDLRGNTREVIAGDYVQAGEVLVVSQGALTLLMAQGDSVNIVAPQTVTFDPELAQSAPPDSAAAALAAASVQQAVDLLAEGESLDELLAVDAPAAGLAADGGGLEDQSHGFIRLLRIQEDVTPPGFDYAFDLEEVPLLIPAADALNPPETITVTLTETLTNEITRLDTATAEGIITDTITGLVTDSARVLETRPVNNIETGTIGMTQTDTITTTETVTGTMGVEVTTSETVTRSTPAETEEQVLIRSTEHYQETVTSYTLNLENDSDDEVMTVSDIPPTQNVTLTALLQINPGQDDMPVTLTFQPSVLGGPVVTYTYSFVTETNGTTVTETAVKQAILTVETDTVVVTHRAIPAEDWRNLDTITTTYVAGRETVTTVPEQTETALVTETSLQSSQTEREVTATDTVSHTETETVTVTQFTETETVADYSYTFSVSAYTETVTVSSYTETLTLGTLTEQVTATQSVTETRLAEDEAASDNGRQALVINDVLQASGEDSLLSSSENDSALRQEALMDKQHVPAGNGHPLAEGLSLGFDGLQHDILSRLLTSDDSGESSI